MAHLQYMPGDQRLVDQLVYELKSKGIFDQFRKDCIADVDTRPAYQNLRQRVESSVSMFLSRQKWRPDLNKNQLREKLRKHILDGNYLEQGVERIVDQVVNPKVASVFIPQVEDLVYNYLGIPRKKSVATAETSNGKDENLLPTDLEAVSPGSVKSNEDKNDPMELSADSNTETKMEIDEDSVPKSDKDDHSSMPEPVEKDKDNQESRLSGISELTSSSDLDRSQIPLPAEIRPENIPPPENSPPNKLELSRIELPKDVDIPLPEIPLPEDIPLPEKGGKDSYFKPLQIRSEDEDSDSSDATLRRNMSPLTPVRNFDDENSCDAQQGFNDSSEVTRKKSSFSFALDSKSNSESSMDAVEDKKTKENVQTLSNQFENKVNINLNTPMYDDSSNSNMLHIDYESDANSKLTDSKLPEQEQPLEAKKEQKSEEKKSSHKSSHRSRDSHRHRSRSKEKRSDSKHSSSRDKRERSSKDDKKSSKDERSSSKSKSSHKSNKDRSDKKESKDSSKHSSTHTSSSSHKDYKSHRSSSSSQKHSSSKHSDNKKPSSSSSHKDKSSSKEHKSSKESKSSSSKSDKDRKSSSSRTKEEKDKDKKGKKDTDDHYSLSGRGNINRRSTDRDSNDGNSSSSKGSQNNNSSLKTSGSKKEKNGTSKSGTTTSGSDSTCPSDKESINNNSNQPQDGVQPKPVRVETHLEMPISQHSAIRFMPEVVLKKPKFAANMQEARRLMKMRKFLDEEQRRMNQEASLLLEFQANVRPSLSQVYSSIPGPELEFACDTSAARNAEEDEQIISNEVKEETVDTEITQSNEEIESFNDVIQNVSKDSSDTVESVAEIQKELDILTNIEETDDMQNKLIVISEEYSENEDSLEEMHPKINRFINKEELNRIIGVPEEITVENNKELLFFGQQEKYNAELEVDRFSKFLNTYTEDSLHLINCNTHIENIFRDVSEKFGQYKIVSYCKNGHIKLPKATTHVDFENEEVILPRSLEDSMSPEQTPEKSKQRSPLFSPVKSECSFELSSDYDAKLAEMVKTTSRQQIMEIILGGVIDESPSKMPTIDICNESDIVSSDIVSSEMSCKRKLVEMEGVENNNRQVLTTNKIRKTSGSDQITSTTEETEETTNNLRNNTNIVRSKYLGKARRVGLPKPRRTALPKSPSSDKSVENYSVDSPPPHPPAGASPLNGKLSRQPRHVVQRYDTADLYKPKLHYLSRRNNIT